MALMTFGQDYSVGVETVDSQHKGLFDIVNELHGAMLKGQAQKLTGPLLNKLVSYTLTHFATEEEMMTATQYPGLEAHKAEHVNLVKQVAEYVERHERGEVTLNLHLLNFLRDWLANHILKVDKEFGPWLNEHGVH